MMNVLCVFREKFHFYCPGCGGTRALNTLLHFQIIDSLRYNPILIIILIDILFSIISKYIEIIKQQRYKYYMLRFKGKVYILIFLIGYTIIRNILLILFRIDLLGDIIH